MNRSGFAAVLLLLSSVLFASPADVKRDTEWFNSLPDREDGSAGEKEALRFIAQRLEELNIPYTRTPLDKTSSGYSYSASLSAVIPGTRPGNFILAAPVDGGAFSLAFLLEIAQTAQKQKPKHNMILMFLGAETGESPSHPFGSRQAASEYSGVKETFTLYIDSAEVPQYWRVDAGESKKITPGWLVRDLTRVLSSLYIPYHLRGTDIQMVRFGLRQGSGALGSWLNAGIPAIRIRGGGRIETRVQNQSIRTLKEAVFRLDNKIETIPGATESSYLFFKPFSALMPQVIPELHLVAGLLGISALLLILALLRFRPVVLNLRRYGKYWWAMLLLFALVFLFFFLATLLVEETLLLNDFPELWHHVPGTFVFFKFALAVVLSLNFMLLTRSLPLPRTPHFYSYTAVAISVAGTIVLLAFNITAATYSIWTTVMLFMLTSLRNIRWKTAFLLLAMLPYLISMVVTVQDFHEGVTRALLLNRVSTNLIATLILMPFISAFTSLHYWRTHYKKTRENLLLPAASFIFTIILLSTLLWILQFNPYGPDNPQPVLITDNINLQEGKRTLQISSPAPIGSAVLTVEGSHYPLEDLGRRAEVRAAAGRVPLVLEHNSHSFLGRKTIHIQISGEAPPEKLEIILNSSKPFTLHEANFPFEVAPGGTSVKLFTGNNPPLPLNIKLTVNREAEITLSCTAQWDAVLSPAQMIRENLQLQNRRVANLAVSL
ncbi:MAG: hypothetical protein CSA76_02875 [Spirochaetales bacterium]|nr:MAG: hypothetical protein CSA76_02875 [Spirochaetales bacterium]